MAKKKTLDVSQLLLNIAGELGNGDHLLQLAMKLDLSKPKAEELGHNCYRILCEAKDNAPFPDDFMTKLRGALIDSGYTDIADKYLPVGTKSASKQKGVDASKENKNAKTDPTSTEQTSPKKKGASNLSLGEINMKLARENTELRFLVKQLGELHKKIDKVCKTIDNLEKSKDDLMNN